MTRLLDGNVLVALSLDGHVHHELASEWFAASTGKFATCSSTEGTLLRVHMSLAKDGSAHAAWEVLMHLRNHPRHLFWSEGFSYAEIDPSRLTGARQVTDAWLAALCQRKKSKLATLDSGLAALHQDVAELIRG